MNQNPEQESNSIGFTGLAALMKSTGGAVNIKVSEVAITHPYNTFGSSGTLYPINLASISGSRRSR
jgi:hypothetical protein